MSTRKAADCSIEERQFGLEIVLTKPRRGAQWSAEFDR